MATQEYSDEFLKASCTILAVLYAIIGLFPLLWGFPFRNLPDTRFIFLFFTPFLLMAGSFYLITRNETNFPIGAIVGVLTFLAVLFLIFTENALVNAIILLFYAFLYGIYYLRSYAVGAVHEAELRGMDSIIEATRAKIIYTPLLLIFLLLLSLAS